MASPRRPAVAPSFIGAVEDEWELYSDRAVDYTVGLPIGFGASSTVYAAVYRPISTSTSSSPSTDNAYAHAPVPCALKILDLDRLPRHSLRLLERETQLMSLSKHPNVLRVRGSWQDGHKICIALRLMNAGSAADVMRYGWPGGMEEEVVRCVLRQALEGLNYLHVNGFIHRDVKAANLLIDDDGTVLLGDLGVAAPLHDEDHSHHPHPSTSTSSSSSSSSHSSHHPSSSAARPRKVGKRRSFVGTPCWMAPELIAGKHYDSSADIWSFGITALELAQGRAPRSRESPSAVLLQTVHDASPTLNREGGVHKYSRAFKEVIDACLVKDPALRPTAAQLLQLPFFKNAKRKSYLVNTILRGLPPLTKRIERRRVPSVHVQGTVASWDFNPTLHNAVASIRTQSQSQTHGPDVVTPPEPNDEGVFAFDRHDDIERHHHRHRHHHRPDVKGGGELEAKEDALPPPSLSVITPPSPASAPTSLSGSSDSLSVPPSPSSRPVPIQMHAEVVPVAKTPAVRHAASFGGKPASTRTHVSASVPAPEGLWGKIKGAAAKRKGNARLGAADSKRTRAPNVA